MITVINLIFGDSGDGLAYNLVILRKSAGIVLSLLFLAASMLEPPLQAQQQPDATRVTLLAESKSSSVAQNVEHALTLDPANVAAAALKRDITSGAVGKASSPHP